MRLSLLPTFSKYRYSTNDFPTNSQKTNLLHVLFFPQDAKNGAEIKAVDAYCWLHSTVHLDTSLMRKLNTLPKIREEDEAAMPTSQSCCRRELPDMMSTL